MLYTNEIMDILKNDQCLKPYFKGVFPSNMMPTVKSLPLGFIVNVDMSSQPGSHWLSIFINRSGFGIFFDSFGQHPRVYKMDKYMTEQCTSWDFNNRQYQHLTSTACGYYSMFVQILMCHGYVIDDIVKCFTIKYQENDIFVNDFIVNYFDLITQ